MITGLATANTIDIKSNSAIGGNYLVDGNGMTLYYFSNDGPGNGISTCYGVCSNDWPPFYAKSFSVPSGLNLNDFRTITRDDGRAQTTYKGWPLYMYSGDKAAGDVNGNGHDGMWFTVNPDRFPPK